MQTRILNVECPDRRGLVHAVTGVLLGESLNVVGNQEFVDPSSQRFFMRTEVQGDLLRGPDGRLSERTLAQRLIRRLQSEAESQPGARLCGRAAPQVVRAAQSLAGELAERFGARFVIEADPAFSRERLDVAAL